MRKFIQFLPLFFFWITFYHTGWGQFLNTLYTHREIDFFAEQEELEGFDMNRTLIPNTEIYINFNTGIGFIHEKNNFLQIQNLINTKKDTLNQDREATNQLEYFKENNVKPYQIGVNVDVFIYKYFGIGFTYTRNHYFSHLAAVSPSSHITNYYNDTVSYSVDAIGNNFQFTVMGRYPFGSRYDNNIFLVGGLGYSFSSLSLTLHFEDKINSERWEQQYSAQSHSFHFFTELIFKIKHLNFGFGLLQNTIQFNNYTLPENPKFTPQSYESLKLGPILYFKVGFNF